MCPLNAAGQQLRKKIYLLNKLAVPLAAALTGSGAQNPGEEGLRQNGREHAVGKSTSAGVVYAGGVASSKRIKDSVVKRAQW